MFARQQTGQAQAGHKQLCPEGHELLPWTAPAGVCQGCGKIFPNGEQVMDCRRCEWMLCEICCPRAGASASIWGTLSQLPFYAADNIDASFNAWDEALDNFIERHGPKFEAADKVIDAVADKIDSFADMLEGSSDSEEPGEVLSNQDREEAQEVVAEFCETFLAERPMPSKEELDQFWSHVSLLYARSLDPRPISEAVRRQLAALNQGVQPAEMRALSALDDWCSRGAVGCAIVADVMSHEKSRVQHLAGENAEGGDDAEWQVRKFACRLLSEKTEDLTI